jgi:pimeloyl-ACP methyl ester carboxylesterase
MMTRHERVRVKLDAFKCDAWLSRPAPATHAVVFVHGFNGNLRKTWRRFTDLLAPDVPWATTDLYFVGYPSVSESIPTTAAALLGFLDALLPNPDDVLGEPAAVVRAPGATTYDRLSLVGHSQGGVIVRQAALEASQYAGMSQDTTALTFVRNAGIYLFAPAINGARPSGMKGAALRSFGVGSLARVIFGASPSYAELQQDSNLLRNLRADTIAAAGVSNHACLSARIIWAADDSVVIPGQPYPADQYSVTLRSVNHSTVCKPTDAYTEPIDFLEDGDVHDSKLRLF